MSARDDPTGSATAQSDVTCRAKPPRALARRRSGGFAGYSRWGRRCCLTLVGVLAVWANRQVLNAENWSGTSTALLQDTAIRTEISDYVVAQLYANVNVAGQLKTALPPQLQALAGPVAGGLQNLAQKAAYQLLGHPRVQAAWKAANRITAQQFIDIVEGKSRLVLLNGNAVFLDLRPIAVDLGQQLGLPSSLTDSIPTDAARLKLISSIHTGVEYAVRVVWGLAIILPAIALILFALAVFLAEGRRRHTLLLVGIDLVIAGLVVIVVRNVAGHQVVNSLVTADSEKPAAQAAWSIHLDAERHRPGHDHRRPRRVLAASLAGPSRPATAFRRTPPRGFATAPGRPTSRRSRCCS